MKVLTSLKPLHLSGKKFTLSDCIWRESIFKFSKYRFFLNFFFNRLTYFSLLLESKNFNFLDSANFHYKTFPALFSSPKLIKILNNNWKISENYYFCEFKILGLGLRLKKKW